MQLKGLAVKETPIHADSAVIRHGRLQISRGRRAKSDRKVKAMYFPFQPGVLATCLSVGTLPNIDRYHLSSSP